jgi:hypothetical protein
MSRHCFRVSCDPSTPWWPLCIAFLFCVVSPAEFSSLPWTLSIWVEAFGLPLEAGLAAAFGVWVSYVARSCANEEVAPSNRQAHAAMVVRFMVVSPK